MTQPTRRDAFRALALDGSVIAISLTLDADSLQFSPWTSGTVFEVGGTELEFTSGELALGGQVADELNVILTDSFQLETGRLRIGSTERVREDRATGTKSSSTLQVAVWEGERYSVFAVGSSADPLVMVELFGDFAFGETASGVAMKSIGLLTKQSRWYDPWLMCEVPEVGVLVVRPVPRGRARGGVPKWSGSQVAGGSLYCGTVDGSEWLELVNDSALVTVLPDPASLLGRARLASEARILRAVSSIAVEWDSSIAGVGASTR